MSKLKGKISVSKAVLLAWNDEIKICRQYDIKEVIHSNQFIDRVRAYVNGGSMSGVTPANSYKPKDGNIDRRLRELRTEGLLNYEYKNEVYYVLPIKIVQ